MTYPCYPAYKPSGVEWLGDVPELWEKRRIRQLAKDEPGSFIDGDWIESPFITDEGVRLIQTGNIGIGSFREQGFRYISEDTFRALNCTAVAPGDILICRLAYPVGRACLAPRLTDIQVTSVDVCILKTNDETDANYYVYLFSSMAYLNYLESVSRGGTRERVSRSFLGSVEVPYPPLDEQRAIAAFLDRETAQIDALIAKLEQLIALLQEKRQALISHAVTKGLDPSVPMKDSGVEWLGQVPEHWTVTAIKHVAELLPGFAFKSDDFNHVGEGERLLRGINVGVGHIEWAETVWYMGSDVGEQYRLNLGDVVLGMDRPVISGGTRISEIFESDAGTLLVQRVLRIRGQSILSRYLHYALSGPAFQSYIAPIFSGVSVPHISESQVGAYSIALPPSLEVVTILGYLDSKICEIEGAVTSAQEAIALGTERRAALITAAVTGSIDVRGLVQPVCMT